MTFFFLSGLAQIFTMSFFLGIMNDVRSLVTGSVSSRKKQSKTPCFVSTVCTTGGGGYLLGGVGFFWVGIVYGFFSQENWHIQASPSASIVFHVRFNHFENFSLQVKKKGVNEKQENSYSDK